MFQQKDGVPEWFELAQRANLFPNDEHIKTALTNARNASFDLYQRKRETDTIPLEELTKKDLEARNELKRHIEDAFQRKLKPTFQSGLDDTSQTDQSPRKKARRDDSTGGKGSKRRKSRKSRRRQKK